MSINLSEFSPRELDALIAKAKQRKTVLKKRKPIAVVRSKIAALAEAEGYSVADLFGGGRGRSAAAAPRAAVRKGRKLGKVAPKYRNPANPKETWTGRGKQPRWLAAQVAQGRKVENFLITKGVGGRVGAAKPPAGRKTTRKTARKTTSKAAGKRTRKTAGKTVRKAGKKKS